jgi:hypothetical protein
MTTYTGTAGVFSGFPPVIDEANPTHSLGEKMFSPDGRAWRYVRAGGTLVLGNLLQGPAETAGAQSRIVAAAVVGALEVTTTDTLTATANQFAGGWIVVTGEAGTGTGGQYRIKSHPAVTAAVCTFVLEDPIQVALSAATQVDIVQNIYNGVIQMPTAYTSCVVGVASNEITDGNYGWIQVAGVAAVKNDATGAVVVGNQVVASKATVGSIQAAANDSTELYASVGYAVTGIATSEWGSVKLNIE